MTKMHGHVSEETPVSVPAALIWDVYRGFELGRLVNKLASDVLGSVEFLEGDGGVGSIAKLTYPPGTPGYLIEKFTKIDDENRVKETEMLEGGFLALGFDAIRIRIEILEKDSESCIVRSSVEYEGDEKLADVVSHVSAKPLGLMAEIMGKHLSQNKSTV